MWKWDENLLAWDIEIRDTLEDFAQLPPFGITCASTATTYGDERVWSPAKPSDDVAMYRSEMSRDELWNLVLYMHSQLKLGIRPVAWNGVKFDFHALAAEFDDTERRKAVIDLMWESVDPFFTMVAIKGFGTGLEKTAVAMGVEGKTHGMSGALAPEYWTKDRAHQNAVLRYVMQDSVATLNVIGAILEAQGKVQWMKRKGGIGTLHLPAWEGHFPTVRESMTFNYNGWGTPFIELPSLFEWVENMGFTVPG